ncbi:MAG: SulP family inorganic anion transporter [Chlorobi bacterium]|nr:SulP family inorganic anion transporter [Chlorobiota bacterium]
MLKKIFPFLNWFENYNVKTLHYDLISGITVALIVIPQSMAYAQLAGLPTYYGLYASFLPTIFASLFGSSNQLSTGPTAVVSLMTAVALEPLATAGSEAYITYAILLAFTVGAFRLSLGILKLGLIINFLPLTVVNGYTSAAAIIIATSQLSRIFGVYVASSHYHYQTVINIIKTAIDYTHLPTLYMAIFSFILMYILKKYIPKMPFVLAAVVITTLVSWAIGYEHNVKININDIKYPAAVKMIKQFDKDMELLQINSSKRATLKEKIDVMKSADTNTIKILDEEYYSSLLGIKINEEKHETHKLRDNLNSLKFQAIKSSGRLIFYKYGSVPEDLNDDGRIWRLKVRNAELNIDNIIMMGGGIVVGDIPKGLPSFVMPEIDLNICLRFLPMAAIISLLGFMETISIGKSIAVKTGQKIDPNQELIGQGIANIVGAFGQCYPVSGSFSRSAVNFQSGGKTGISSFVTSIIIVLVLFFFTPLLYYLPKAVLASIIMMAVVGLINIKGFICAWQSRWYDGVISVVTFIVTLAFAPHLEIGIATGIVLSLIVYLYKSMRPRIVTLSMAPDFSLRSAKRFDLQECGYIAALRVEGSIFFASSTYLDDVIDETIRTKKKLRHFLIVCNGVNDMDYTGVCALEQVIKKVRARGLGISFSGINDKVLHLWKKTKITDLIGKENIYPTMIEALEDLFYKTHEKGATNVLACPLMNYIPKGSKKIFEIN